MTTPADQPSVAEALRRLHPPKRPRAVAWALAWLERIVGDVGGEPRTRRSVAVDDVLYARLAGLIGSAVGVKRSPSVVAVMHSSGQNGTILAMNARDLCKLSAEVVAANPGLIRDVRVAWEAQHKRPLPVVDIEKPEPEPPPQGDGDEFQF